jgi:hypothetical protein
LFGDWKQALTPLANPRFDSEAARRRLEGFYGVKALDGFGSFGRAEIAAAGALVDYVALTQQVGADRGAPHLAPPQLVLPDTVMQIDAATRHNLELVATLSGERRGSLLATIDRTLTGPGARLLAEQLAAPLTLPDAIRARLDAVEFFLERADMRAALRQILRRVPDIERALTRLSLGRGGPRDLAALAGALGETARVRAILLAAGAAPGLVPLPELLARAEAGLGEHRALVDRLGRALAADPGSGSGAGLPLFAREGGFIAAGYAQELDQLRELRDDSRRAIAALQARYAEASGVASLRIRHNNVIGYYIEVSKPNVHLVPADFERKQTLFTQCKHVTGEGVTLGIFDLSVPNHHSFNCLGSAFHLGTSAANSIWTFSLTRFALWLGAREKTTHGLEGSLKSTDSVTITLRIDPRLDPDRRYCRPWTREFVEDLADAYHEQFGAQIQVNSAVRTVVVQKKLRRHNRNAAPAEGEIASSYLAGVTVDLQRRGMSKAQIHWVENYLVPLKAAGLVEPEEERRQWVFHIMVSDRYSEWRDKSELAQRRMDEFQASEVQTEGQTAPGAVIELAPSGPATSLMAPRPVVPGARAPQSETPEPAVSQDAAPVAASPDAQ